MLFGVLLFALVGSVATHTLTARQSLLTQLQLRNDDGAMMLALALSQQHGDEARMGLVAAAQFDTGHYLRLRVLRTDGTVLFEREQAAQSVTAPQWFARALPVLGMPGVAQVSDGWRPLGSLELSSQAAWATDELWSGFLRMAGWLTVLGAVAAAVAAAAVRAWRRPLDATVAQAQALEERRFVIATRAACARAATADAQHELAGAPAARRVREAGGTTGGAAPTGASRWRDRPDESGAVPGSTRRRPAGRAPSGCGAVAGAAAPARGDERAHRA